MSDNTAKPTVSIVIPTYNRKDLLSEAVASCLGQTWKDLEIIVVDDGSTDGTREFVAKMLASTWGSMCVTYRYQANQGASSARNHGMRLAQGDYVQFLDSDDLLMPTKIARQVATLRDQGFRSAPCCYCYGSIRSRSGGGGAERKIGAHEASARALIQRLCSRMVHVMSTPAPLWRRDHLQRHLGWREDIALGDDLEYYVRLLVDAHDPCFVDDELFVVREHVGDRLSVFGATVLSVSSLLKARRSVYESVKRAGLWDEDTQEAFLGAMRTIYASALETGDAKLVADLERWLWELASAPRRRLAFQAMILTRRVLGAQSLLRTHRMVRRLRGI